MKSLTSATAFVAILLGLATCQATAQSINQADRIEEDWVLVADETASADGPQVNTVMGPTSDQSLGVFVLDINYRHDPVYSSQGLQVLIYGKYGLVSSNTVGTNPLQLANQTVQWTQRMSLSGGSVQYSIPAVNSTNWGSLPSTSVLASFTAPLTSFKDYDPDVSASNSGGAWKTQGLKTLTLVQVRYYVANVLIATDKTARPVDCTQPFTRP